MTRVVISLAESAVLLAIACSAMARQETPYPQGSAFPLMMYAASPTDARNLTPHGWNVLQYYGLTTLKENSDYLQGLSANATTGVAEIPASGTNHPYVGWPESLVQSWIQNLAAIPNLAWWSLPEEMRPGVASEQQILSDYTSWTRAFDPQRRPTYEYVANGRGAASISQIVSNVDLIGVGCYCEYIGMPHAWVRYVVHEAALKGIAMAGATVGNNYLAGQKTPVAVLYCAEITEVNTNPPTMPLPSQSYHDFWSAIASGAKGISVYAYWHALHDDPSLVANLQQLNIAASQISGWQKIGDVVLYGVPNTNVTFTITSGPLRTVAFKPPSERYSLQYPSLNLLSLTWSNSVYVIAVNSTEESVGAIITNLPSAAASAAVPFESRVVTLTDGGFTDEFPAWGVHIYKMPAQVVLYQFTIIGHGLFEFRVTDSGVSRFTVLTSTDFSAWTEVGSATPVSPGVYQFTDPDWSSGKHGLYRLRWP